MPYITRTQRVELAAGTRPHFVGELNYAITQLCAQFVKDRDLSYQTINDVLGALEGAKQEFYRRVAVPYENSKLALNGDVYL